MPDQKSKAMVNAALTRSMKEAVPEICRKLDPMVGKVLGKTNLSKKDLPKHLKIVDQVFANFARSMSKDLEKAAAKLAKSKKKP